MKSFLFVVGLVIALGATALAQPVDALKKAQTAFDQAQIDYLQGKYDDAAKGFEDAYTARQFPQFLYNIGAAHHMKGKKASDADAYGKAKAAARQALAIATPSPHRSTITRWPASSPPTTRTLS